MEDEPIYKFQGLKDLLTRKGYHIGKAETWRKIDSEEVSIREGNLEFSDEGIFLVDEDGVKRQVYLYKRKYHLERYGKPRFHICKCQTIQEFLSGKDIPQYRRANTSSVKVLNMDNGDEEVEVSDLPLCKYCAAIIYDDKNYDMDSSEFAEILQNSASTDDEQLTDAEINPRTGYTRDWQEISSEFREQHSYICEKCGIQVTPFDSEFMHVHHKNLNKTDNRERNLQCLCIKCHSEVDATHVRNFSTKSQRLLLKLFNEKYGVK